jgi:hypothetical protein
MVVTDLKGLFGTLAQVEEHRSLDVKIKKADQERYYKNI